MDSIEIFDEPLETEHRKCTYAGIIDSHFGHFLLESLSRVWFLREFPDRFPVWHKAGNNALSSWQIDIAKLVGIDLLSAKIIERVSNFSDIVVPDPGFVIGEFFTSKQASAMGIFPGRPPKLGKRVWISRTALPSHVSHVYGVEKVEDALEASGWTIFHPEAHTILDQLHFLADAEVIAGMEGSAFHLMILYDEVRSKIRIIQRHRAMNNNYKLIADTKNINQQTAYVEVTQVTNEGAWSKLRIQDGNLILQFVNG